MLEQVEMQNSDDNIDLDALFDMLNILRGQPASGPGVADSVSAQSDQAIFTINDLSPIGSDLFMIDLPSDQS